MFSPLRLFLAIAFRLLAPLNMMNAEDAGSSSASGGGGGASKKRSNEENKINVYWKGFLDAQIQAEHANLRAIAHAGRLDTMRRSIYWGYKQNPSACTNVALAVNCSSADKFLEYTLEASLMMKCLNNKSQTNKNMTKKKQKQSLVLVIVNPNRTQMSKARPRGLSPVVTIRRKRNMSFVKSKDTNMI